VFPHKNFKSNFPTFGVFQRQRCSGSGFLESNPEIMRSFWIRRWIGYHFCSSRIRIIQNVL